jgi:predicted regulator of Ras-like GTPase activity (Roadblock/LC7/MglB family)
MTMGKTSVQWLEPFLEIPGVSTIAIVGRDGFVLDIVGNTVTIPPEALGASVSLVFNGIQNMGRDLNVLPMRTVTIEYQGAMILCSPVGEAICTVVCPDSNTLGVIRHKIKGLLLQLASYY